MNDGPILIVDDDMDDREFLQEAWKDLPFENELIFFDTGLEVLDYLKSEQVTPFLILCDVNLPKLNGFQLKEKIRESAFTNHKSIPFVFWSTSASVEQIQTAYAPGVNGFFIKESTFEKVKESWVDIVKYWRKSRVPE